MRKLIRAADPEVVEDVQWRKPSNPSGVPVWEHAGILCTGEVYKDYVKLTFARARALDGPAGLFNAGFGGGTAVHRHPLRARDRRGGFKALREAVGVNVDFEGR